MVLVSHRYKFIYLKNYKTASSSVESFFQQFCIDPAEQSDYTFEDKTDESITQYGIVSSRQLYIDNDGNRIRESEEITKHNIKIREYIRYKLQLNNETNIIKPDTIWICHKQALDIKKDIGDEIFNQYIKFCVIRNPYDSIVSAYHWIIYDKMPDISFKNFCINYFTQFSNKYIANDMKRIFLDDIPVCNYYIRYENLKEDIEMVLQKLDITEYDIEKLPTHKSKIRPENTPYQSYYDDETRELVYTHYKKMIDYFGYTF
jgi:hypothetical protein